MAEDHWLTLEEIEAQDRGRINEAKVTAYRERMRDEQRAHRLAEIRKLHGLTQTDVAAAMCVSQRRVSAVERGALTRTELGTVASYVAALGGCIEIVANFGDERIVIASGEPGVAATDNDGVIASLTEACDGLARLKRPARVQARKLRAHFCGWALWAAGRNRVLVVPGLFLPAGRADHAKTGSPARPEPRSETAG